MSIIYSGMTYGTFCDSRSVSILRDVKHTSWLVKRFGRADHISMATDKIAALRATDLFGSLTNEELRALASLCTEHKLSREQVLFIAGEEACGLYVVVSGAVRALRAGAYGCDEAIPTERAGAI